MPHDKYADRFSHGEQRFERHYGQRKIRISCDNRYSQTSLMAVPSSAQFLRFQGFVFPKIEPKCARFGAVD
jgi:hypothetical protein